MTTQTTRRTVLGGIAAASVIALPATAAEPHPDAELLAAYRDVLDLEGQFKRAVELSRPYWDVFDRRVKAISRDHQRVTDEQYQAAHDEAQTQSPYPTPSPDDLSDKMDKPMRTIMSLPACTPAGLGVKAGLVRLGFEKLWDKPFEDLDWDDMKLRALVDGVLDFASRQAGA